MRSTPPRSPLARAARGVFAASALAVVALALVGTVKIETARRDAQADALRMREYSALGQLATSQNRRLALGGVPVARGASFAADAKRTTDVLRELQAQSSGAQSSLLTALQVSFVTAMQRAKSGDVRSLQQVLPLLQTTAARKLGDLQSSPAGPLGGSPLEQIGLVAMALIAIANLLWLFRLGLLYLRGPIPWDGRDQRVEELQVQALTDNLTKLGNHRAFHNDLSAALRRRTATGAHFALMAVDLDGLKRINDTRGHPAGDEHIKGITQCLRTVIGPGGAIYRTGGDEFMVILPKKRNWDALLIANKIDQATRQFAGARAVSIGLTETTGIEGRQLLVHQADLALYEAKRTKLRAVAYHPGLARRSLGGSPNAGPTLDQRALAAALARAVDAKDNGTRSHSEMVSELSVAVGGRLGITGDRLERLRLAGLLHDVGKIGVADAILQKREALADDERLAMADHVTIGQAILAAADLPIEADWILHHHERYDGKGYPAGRHGEEIPIEARIISTVDAFEAMTGTRPYRDSISTNDALAELRRAAGTQFDIGCVEALIAVVENHTDLLIDEPAPPVELRRPQLNRLVQQAS